MTLSGAALEQATSHRRNVASVRLLQKIGMTYEGRRGHDLLLRDRWRDTELFGVLEHEWHGGRGAG